LLSETLRGPIPEVQAENEFLGRHSAAGNPENDKSVQHKKGDDCKMNA
jgi:hypothetical protein